MSEPYSNWSQSTSIPPWAQTDTTGSNWAQSGNQNWSPYNSQPYNSQPYDSTTTAWPENNNSGSWPQNDNASNWSQDDSAINWAHTGSTQHWSQNGTATSWSQNDHAGNWSENDNAGNWSQLNSSTNWYQPNNSGGWFQSADSATSWAQSNYDNNLSEQDNLNYWPPPARLGEQRGGKSGNSRGRGASRHWQKQRKTLHWRKDKPWLQQNTLNQPARSEATLLSTITQDDTSQEWSQPDSQTSENCTEPEIITSTTNTPSDNSNQETLQKTILKQPAMSTTSACTQIVAQPAETHTLQRPTMMKGKSHACELNDLAFKQGQKVQWVEEAESGPAHNKVFSIKAIMGAFHASGNGKSKKLAKQNAAEAMLNQIQIVGMVPTSEAYGPQRPTTTTTTTNMSKNISPDPVSKLQQVTAKHGLGPVEYTTTREDGPTALEKFDIKVQIQNMQCTGLGRSKKTAKRNAAQAMLDQLSKSNPKIAPPQKRIMFVAATSKVNVLASE